MRAFIFGLMLFGFTNASFADGGFLSNVSLKVNGDEVSPQVKCFVDESLKQVFPEYTLEKISFSTIQENTAPEDAYASVHYLAIHKETGKIERISIQLSSFDDDNKWKYVQDENSLYPFNAKVSDFATTGIKGELPYYLLLDVCQ